VAEPTEVAVMHSLKALYDAETGIAIAGMGKW
jgi:hypothetical protein